MTDPIERQDAINAICMECHDGICDKYPCGEIKALEQLPSAQPEPQWIPCSERLPEEEQKEYWICTDTGYQCECRWTNVNHFWTDLTTSWHWHIMDVPQYTKVVAWMPLPKPYKGGADMAEREGE